MNSVPVNRRKSTVVDATLNVGSVTQTVEVQAELPLLQTSSASLAVLSAGPRTTPRLREYFPETLLWAPSLETGVDGQAQLKFHLADSITTWKLEAIGSTVDGEIGTATVDIRAFQAFFADHNPRRVLTQGDEIRLPVIIRNYLDQAQKVDVSIKPETWFQVVGGERQQVYVASAGSNNAVFSIRAIASIDDGKQRITATSPAAGDAIEKPVSVHPDGREVSVTQNTVLLKAADLDLTVPDGAIQGSIRAELKIYPNLMAHVIDSIDGILHRPYGCAEQTISSTYPSLMLLGYLQRVGRQGHA